MKKVFQTIVDKDYGNCMQAAIASLLELELDEVPNFIKYKDGWFLELWELLKKHGYTYNGSLYNYENNKRLHPEIDSTKIENRFHELKEMEGVHSYFYASVYSPKYYDSIFQVYHSVIIDKDCNIVHDPNPEYKNIIKYPLSDEIGYNGIVDIFMIEPMVK